MKSSYSRSLAAFVLAILLILHSWPRSGAQASRVLLTTTTKQDSSSSSSSSSSSTSTQVLDVQLQGNQSATYMKASTARGIPPSGANPTQNK
ncbi:hypothetical protein RHMOL_Rhmol12G0248900 [Rhododendron molle]|uniref:Uncharacterized protein n=1 Tax=Rhododendron molle TaxID=49168 RepID=A0ACC0LMY0_RHOML|nr:hypothetical protein RHMOL_Rhmol12G0248900 [Rhododendron molle]